MDDTLTGAMRDKMPAGFLDFDGALYNGNLSIDFIRHLSECGLYDRKLLNAILKAGELCKKGAISYETFRSAGIALWAEGMRGKRVEHIERAAESMLPVFKGNIYSSSYKLISALESNGYLPIIVSVGIFEVNSVAARELNVKMLYGTVAERDNGIYTGRIASNIHLPEGKSEILDSLASGIDMSRSFAFSDSMADVGMLERVGIPVVLNSTDSVKNIALERGWTVASHENVLKEVIGLIRKDRENARTKSKAN